MNQSSCSITIEEEHDNIPDCDKQVQCGSLEINDQFSLTNNKDVNKECKLSEIVNYQSSQSKSNNAEEELNTDPLSIIDKKDITEDFVLENAINHIDHTNAFIKTFAPKYQFKCKICGKLFYLRMALRQHIKMHSKNECEKIHHEKNCFE